MPSTLGLSWRLAALLLLLSDAAVAFAPAAQTSSRRPTTTQLRMTYTPRGSNSRLFSSSTAETSVNGSTSQPATKKKNNTPCFPVAIPWEVHKFGGASLANAELYKTVGDLLLQERARSSNNKNIPTMAVVSARGGMTDLLVKVVDSALRNLQDAETALDEAVATQIAVLEELAPERITAPIAASIRNDAKDILSVVQSLRMLNTVPAVTMEVVTGFGEIWCVSCVTVLYI